jgi:hypothetical protein
VDDDHEGETVANPATTRRTIQVLSMTWLLMTLTPIGADWLTSVGVGEWPAVWVVVTVPVAVLLIGTLYSLRTGKRASWARFLPYWVGGPGFVLGLCGLVTGAASRGHVFVLVFMAIPAAIVLLVLTLEARRADARLHPDVAAKPDSGLEDPLR